MKQSNKLERRGFTLMEIMVAMACSVVIFGAGMQGFIQVSQIMTKRERGSLSSEQARILSETIVSETQGIGGGAVRHPRSPTTYIPSR